MCATRRQSSLVLKVTEELGWNLSMDLGPSIRAPNWPQMVANQSSKTPPNRPKTDPEQSQTIPKRPATTPHASHATTHTSTAAMGWENARHGGRAAGGRGAHFPTPWPLWRCVSWRGWRGVWRRVFWGCLGVIQGPPELLPTKADHGNPVRIGPKRGEFSGHCHIHENPTNA